MRVRRGFDESPVILENHLIPDAQSIPLGASALAATGPEGIHTVTYNDSLEEVSFGVMAKQLDQHFAAVNMRPEADNSTRLKVFEAYMRGDDIAEAVGFGSVSNATKVFLHAVAADEVSTAQHISFLRHTCDNEQDAAVNLLTRGWREDHAERFRGFFAGLQPESRRIMARYLIGESRQQITDSTHYSEEMVDNRIRSAARWLELGASASLLSMRPSTYFPHERDAVTNDLAESLSSIADRIDNLPLRRRIGGEQENIALLTMIAHRRSSKRVIGAIARLTSRRTVRNALAHGLDSPLHV